MFFIRGVGVLPPGLPCASVEAGRAFHWRTITGPKGLNLGVESFGESAPYQTLYEHFGLTADKVAESVRGWLG